MQTINAANNLTIQADEFSWRLSNSQNPETGLVEANDNGFTYQPVFARARRLPESGLPFNQVEMIIVGWEAGYWQLGLLLRPGAAAERGGRWCGLVRWHDPTATAESYSARQAGQLLAGVVGRPYQFVQPEPQPIVDEPEPTPPLPVAEAVEALTPHDEPITPAPSIPRATLPDVKPLPLPIQAGEWSLSEMRNGIKWERSRAWRIDTAGRAIFFTVLTLMFAFLSFGGLRSNFAPVQPEWLPVVGIVVTVLMAFNALGRYLALVATSSIEYDRRNRMIRMIRRPQGVIRQIPFEKIDYVLVSDTPLRRQRVSATETDQIEKVSLETWLHAARTTGDFVEIGHVGQADGRLIRPLNSKRLDREPLTIGQIDTPAHQAAIQIAEMIEVPVYEEESGG